MEINLTAPQSWKELSPKQLIYISWLMCRGNLTEKEFHTYAFVRLTGIKVLNKVDDTWHCKYKKNHFTLSAEQVLSFSGQFTWLTQSIGEVTPLPELKKIAHQDVRLRKLPLEQYLACENYYQAYLFTKKEEFLNKLIASFYLGDEEFNDGYTAERAELFEKLSFHIRHTVFLWFYGLKSVFQKQFPNFFQKVESTFDEKPQAPNMLTQINNMIRMLNGGDITKTETIYKIDTWEALAELDAKARENKELERRMKKLK